MVVGTHTYTTTGAYTDYMTTALGCDSTITTILVVNDTFNIHTTPSICQGDSVVVGAHVYNTAGTYIDHLTTLRGCDSTVTTVLTVNQNPIISVTAIPDTICTGDTATLTATGGSTYIWTYALADTSIINPLLANPGVTTLYNVTGANSFGCKDSTKITVVVYPKSVIDPTSDTNAGCEPKTIKFTANTGGLSYLWNFGDNLTSDSISPTHTYQAAGTYPVTLTVKTLGCTLTFNQEIINVYSQPQANFTWNPTIGTLGIPVNFTDKTTPPDTYTYIWIYNDGTQNDNIQTPSHTFNNVATFNVEMIVVNDHGCADTVKYPVQIIDDSLIFPNIITPNGDNYNDKFVIKGLQQGAYPDNRLVCLNRWGKIVYEKINYQNDFDGEGLPDGVYYYVFSAKGILKDIKHQSSLEILR